MTHREERDKFILRVNRGEVTLTDEQVKVEFHAFVRAVARRRQNQGLTMDELIEAGNKGLLEAWHSFDPAKGIRFVPWAVFFIRTAMENAISNQNQH